MSSEAVQTEQRRANLEAITRLGFAAYPNKFDTTDSVTQLVDAHTAKSGAELEASRVDTVTAGRIVSVRSFGKASFFVLSDGRSRIQVYVRQDALSERDYQLSKLLDVGDQIGVAGHLFRTKTNELSVWAASLQFLAKCFLPLPEKWHGLQDVEIRYRQRYLDLVVNPDVRRVFEIRTATTVAIRDFLKQHGFLEVETPMMQPIAGGALARPFVTHHNTLDMKLYLRIAPELYLKRLTVGGIERVFEINRNFRNEGISTQHNPEFTMLEFYWAYVDYERLMAFTEELLSAVALQVIGTTQFPFGEHTINMAAPFRRLSLRHAAAEAASTRLGRAVTVEELRSLESATAIAQQLRVEVPKGAGAGKIASAIFEALWERDLIQPTFVYDFPTEVSPLSKQRPDDPDTVERFELYVGGFELANAFSELNDPVEQRRRFEAQLADRAAGDHEAHAMDDDYVRALEYGMPPAGGEGIGIDRLVMLLSNSQSIRDVILFPLMRPAVTAKPPADKRGDE
ncbi:MAG TPA: lysine--tRNA ligase [Vicinamibacterales bacterium]|nr:lysine--tRNA ligase [Vicinamibacterales bacterium]